MVTVDTVGRVRRLYFVEKRSIKAIARDLKLARNTVRSIVRGAAETERGLGQNCSPITPELGSKLHAGSHGGGLNRQDQVEGSVRLGWARRAQELEPPAIQAITREVEQESSGDFNSIGVRTFIQSGAPKLDIKLIACIFSIRRWPVGGLRAATIAACECVSILIQQCPCLSEQTRRPSYSSPRAPAPNLCVNG